MEWIRGQRIGQGRFGTVDLAIPRSQMLQVMAVKSSSSTHSASLLNEKAILDELRDCPEIIRSFGACFTLENGEKMFNVLLEYASGGDLGEKVKNCELPEFDVRRCAKSVLRGLHSIHKHGYVHCDIKPQNVLVFRSKFGGNDSVKIADFGLAKKAGKVNLSGCELRGTPMYMSPEMVAGGEQESPADIWAFGCMVSEMVTGSPAWRCRRELNFGELFMRIGVGEEIPEIPTKLSDQGKDFLEKCFLKDPRKRWTAEMLLNHPFVANCDDDSECPREVASTSPKSAFDFPDWVSETTPLSSPEYSLKPVEFGWDSTSFTSGSLSISPAATLHQLVTDQQKPNWSDLGSWVTVRS